MWMRSLLEQIILHWDYDSKFIPVQNSFIYVLFCHYIQGVMIKITNLANI